MYDEERKWTDSNIDMVALKHFPNIDRQTALGRPILYSNWLSKDYIPVDREELREFTRARLKVLGHSQVNSKAFRQISTEILCNVAKIL